MNDISAINEYLQNELLLKDITSVSATEAAIWLHAVGLLVDSTHKPGLPLRRLLRNNQINGQWQDSKHRWFIDRLN